MAALSLGTLVVGLHLSQVAAAKIMQSDRLAAAAADDLPGHPLLSAIQAEKALEVFQASRAELALRNAVQSFQQVRAFHDIAGQKETAVTAVHSAAFDPANENLILYANGAAWIGNIRTGYRLLLTPQEHKRVDAANAIAFNPAGTRVAVGYADGTVALFNASNGKQLLLIRANRGFAAPGVPVHNTSQWLDRPFNGHDYAALQRDAIAVPGFEAGRMCLVAVSRAGTARGVSSDLALRWTPRDVVTAFSG